MQPKIIRVQGHAKVSKNPDTVILSFTIAGRDVKYEQSIRQVNNRVEALRDELERSGIDPESTENHKFFDKQ